MRITTSLIMLLCLGTVAAASAQTKTTSAPPAHSNASAKPLIAGVCYPGALNAYTNLPSSTAYYTATYTYTASPGTYCGTPSFQSNSSWVTFSPASLSCTENGSNYTCYESYDVTQNSGPTRGATLTVVFGQTPYPTTYIQQYGPVEELSVSVSGSGTVTSSPSGISCPGGACSLGIYYGNTYTLTASPATGYKFAGWSGACSGTGTCPLPMTAPENVTATFTLLSETLSVGVSGSGTVTGSGISCPGTCSATYTYGTNVSLTASPATGYVFSGWSGACSGTGACTVGMTSGESVTATFALLETLTVSVSGSGTVTSSPSGISCPSNCSANYTYGTNVSLSASPAAGYQFTGWSGACSGTGVCTVPMTATKSITAKFALLPGYLNTVAGNGDRGYFGDGGLATSAWFWFPQGVATDTAGNIYIADTQNDRIRMVTASTGIITTVAGNGTYGYSGDGGPAISAELAQPISIVVDTSGNIYFGDVNNHRVRMVNASTGIITTVAGNGTSGGSGDGGPATSAEFWGIAGLAVDGSGNIYISDDGNNRVRKVTASTGIITPIVGNGTQGYSGDGGPATSAELSYPNGITLDGSGNLYIADTDNERIREVSASTGDISTVAGSGYYSCYWNWQGRYICGGAYSGDGGLATSADLNNPSDVAVDAFGNIYIADYNNNRIRMVAASTGDGYEAGYLYTVAGNGIAGYSGDEGLATNAELYSPWGVAVDNAGNFYIVDGGNERIREVGN
jgi:uncharacterized repeat protein (TIGR02543 family)